jgi:hypothetical protein
MTREQIEVRSPSDARVIGAVERALPHHRDVVRRRSLVRAWRRRNSIHHARYAGGENACPAVQHFELRPAVPATAASIAVVPSSHPTPAGKV